MNILYGINGTGNGHITKSTQIIMELKRLGHNVDILVSGLNDNIQLTFEPRWSFEGFTFKYKQGSVDFLETIKSSSPRQFLKDICLDISSYDRIVTDFEPITAWSAKVSKRKSIGISHQYSFISDKCPRPNKKDIFSELFLRYYAPVTKPIGLHFEMYDERIYHPVISDSIIKSSIINNGHVCVYLPSYSVEKLINHFQKFDQEIHLFAKVDQEFTIKNIKIKPLSQIEFTKSLISCDKVVTAGGFETPSESLYLGKPLICLPIKGQYEQLCNCEALKRMGVRIVDDLGQLTCLTSNKIDWNWNNPMTTLLQEITY